MDMRKEEKVAYIYKVYGLACAKGLCKNRTEFARLLDINPSSLSAGLNTRPEYLTEKLMERVAMFATENGLDSAQEVAPQPEAKGVFIPAETMDLYTNLSESVRILSETVSRMQLAGGKKNGDTIPASPTLNTKFYE